MLPFAYELVRTPAEAVARGSAAGAAFLAGGTELLCWMRDGLAAPASLVDIGRLPLGGVDLDDEGGLRIGALARLADLAGHGLVRRAAPCLAQAIESAASPAIRSMSTLGGNLLQRTRCPHFRAGPGVPCNRREPGAGCSARAGDHRAAAILGGSDWCISTHPSDPAVALAALDASIEVLGPAGPRRLDLDQLYRPPAAAPGQETGLAPGELITAIRIPARAGAVSSYVKVRDRAAFDFALVSCAAASRVEGGAFQAVRLALGGVASRPWRCRVAEAQLVGGPATPERMAQALGEELAAARPLEGNRFKVELARRVALRALREASG
jgi:xanthine dehydrogenase YagS FAD-binding subunit